MTCAASVFNRCWQDLPAAKSFWCPNPLQKSLVKTSPGPPGVRLPASLEGVVAALGTLCRELLCRLSFIQVSFHSYYSRYVTEGVEGYLSGKRLEEFGEGVVRVVTDTTVSSSLPGSRPQLERMSAWRLWQFRFFIVGFGCGFFRPIAGEADSRSELFILKIRVVPTSLVSISGQDMDKPQGQVHGQSTVVIRIALSITIPWNGHVFHQSICCERPPHRRFIAGTSVGIARTWVVSTGL